MSWKRRKSAWSWAQVAGLLLLLLAMAAPRAWQGLRGPSSSDAQPTASAPPAEQQPVALASKPSSKTPPVVSPSALPAVLAHVSKRLDNSDSSARSSVQDQRPTTGLGERLSIDEYDYDEFFARTLLPNRMASDAPGRKTGSQDATLPVPKEFNLEVLLQVRDALASLMNQPFDEKNKGNNSSPTLRSEQTPKLVLPRVQVRSSKDRLAMLDRRHVRAEPSPALEPAMAAAVRHVPEVLIAQLDRLTNQSPAAAWANRVLGHIRRLTQKTSSKEATTEAWAAQLKTLLALQTLSKKGLHGALEITDSELQYQWLQASQGLERRVELWNALLDPTVVKAVRRANTQENADVALQEAMEAAAIWTVGSERGTEWREYLLLDRIAAATDVETKVDIKQRRNLARIVLGRMKDARLTTPQREFLATPSLVLLRRGLRPWATGVVNLHTLLALVERYDASRETRYADAIAEYQHRLQWSSEPRLNALANHLDKHFRSANMRIAVTGELLNRMMPSQKTKVAPVRGKIAGTKVRGQSKTSTQLRVRLMPDAEAWRFGLEAFGTVLSQTKSDTWPARVRNKAQVNYQAQKQIVISSEGLQLAPTRVSAQGSNELVGVESQFDPVPLLGSWLRKVARDRHANSHSIATRQAKSRVTQEARRQMDRKADLKLHNLERRFHEKVLVPFEQLALVAEPIQMHTTERRAVMRLRLSSGDQLAAHTPRPSAPSDSLLSVQLHESALNNAARGIGLDGRRMTLGELFELIATKFGKADLQPPADLPLRTVVDFAAHDAVRIRCDGGRIELLLSIDSLSHGRDKITGFQVHAFFRPQLEGMQVTFVRDGTLHFSGHRIRTGPRIILHSVFGKLLHNQQQLSLLPEGLKQDSRFSGLMVTQLMLQEGWLALAVGPEHPQRVAWRTMLVR